MVNKEKEEGVKYEFSKEIVEGNEKGKVYCFSVNGIKQYKITSKDGNFDGVDQFSEWEKKIENERKIKEKEELEL